MSIKQDSLVTINNSMQDIQSMWKMPQQHINAINKSATIVNSRHGLFSGIPIVCKGTDCPYINTCMIDTADRLVGSRCPQEIGALLSRFERLCYEFNVTEEDSVDLGQLKELVDLEIMMLRCDNKMAFSADILQKSVKDITKSGKIIYEYKVDPVAEFKLELIDKHSRILKDLNGTRDSKKGGNAILDPSQIAADLINKAKELEGKLQEMSIQVVDSEFTEVTDEDVANIYEGLEPLTKTEPVGEV